ncbi:MAG: RNHCP domain-containing protein [Candidatus Gracilibacteria bacterium]|nr:RNHCP domain-containing protein [Candidatus Gracilibacteria bacterium]
MKTPKINESFSCLHCNRKVSAHKAGSCRNHCPSCLYSLHVDQNLPGDRLNGCNGLMKPIAIENHSKKGFMLVHQCEKCAAITKNRLAPDDDMEKVAEIAKGSAEGYL